ncbi:carotenoid biosynthesis protein [Actinoplanes sp. NPDC049265]|uniref:carotenoid biosynthesis protein n=1 Tax=Actinoplanes sp. NPDC049265 TaxID=3363902 RepID=UPI0037182EB6
MRRLPWVLLGALVGVQIGYPLASDRALFSVITVVLGYLFSLTDAFPRRGLPALLAVTVGGFLIEALGVATGFPFGSYSYSGALGPQLLGVPLIIPLAWTWMAWPAWLAATRLCSGRFPRVAVAAFGLAAWDLFLDPQMVAEGYWRWLDPVPALPGLPGIPASNFLGWLGFAVLVMILLSQVSGLSTGDDRPALALWFWTYASSVLAHAVFLDLPASAAWGGVTMGLVVIPLAVRLLRRPS